MAQIFISHSQRDETIKNLFLRAFRGSGVQDIYREYENAPATGVSAELIRQDIELSSAVFVLLSETVQSLPFTRDWILFECGIAVAKQKPIWVFEPYGSFGRITMTIPSFAHYVRFGETDPWRQYINSIAASYDDTPAIARLVVTALGAWVYGVPGAVVSLLGSLAVFPGSEHPEGHPTGCPNCGRAFVAHLPGESEPFRCPNCEFIPLYLRQALVPVQPW